MAKPNNSLCGVSPPPPPPPHHHLTSWDDEQRGQANLLFMGGEGRGGGGDTQHFSNIPQHFSNIPQHSQAFPNILKQLVGYTKYVFQTGILYSDVTITKSSQNCITAIFLCG